MTILEYLIVILNQAKLGILNSVITGLEVYESIITKIGN